MKLYDFAMAPNSRRVRIFIAEKNIEVPVEQIDLLSGENLEEKYREKNQFCLVPTLELDDGTCIDEAPAICSYLESCYPEPRLLGTTPLEIAHVQSWDRHMENQGLACVGEMFRNGFAGFKNRSLPGRDGDKAIPDLIERGRRGVEFFYEHLESRLQQSKYIAGDTYSLADITAFCAIEFATTLRMPTPEGNTKSRSWYDSVAQRPATKA